MVPHARTLLENTNAPALLDLLDKTVKQTPMIVLLSLVKTWDCVWMGSITTLVNAMMDILERIVKLTLMNVQAALVKMEEHAMIRSMGIHAHVLLGLPVSQQLISIKK